MRFEDEYYKGYEIMYSPHPKLYGLYEVNLKSEFIGRFLTKKEARQNINQLITTNKLKQWNH